jgi:peptide/nickel transport system substrate-binding protein
VEADGKSWTFHMRTNSFWSDGQVLNADDVVFTFNDLVYNPDIVNTVADVCRIGKVNFKVSKVDDYTVRVVTPEIFAPMLESFGSVPILPKHVLAKSVAEKKFTSAYNVTSNPEEIVGSGPYKLKAFKAGQSSLLERNPYFIETDKKGQRLPYIDTIIYTIVPNQHTVSLQFLQGESYANERVMPDEVEHYMLEARRGKFTFLDLGPGIESYFFWFNENTSSDEKTGKPYVDPKKSKWFTNKKFRQAVSYAIDRKSIVKSIYHGRAVPAYGYIAPGNPKWMNTNLVEYGYDLRKARALLAEIGIKDHDAEDHLKDADGNTIEFVLNTNTGNPVREQTALMVIEDLKKLGFKVTYQPVEFNTFINRIEYSFDYDCGLISLGGSGTDPAGHMNVLKSDGFTHQWYPRQKTPATPWEARIDELMNDQIKTLDLDRRMKDFTEVQAIINEEMPAIYTIWPISYAAVRSDLGNLRPTVLSYYRVTWNAEELYFK